MEDDGPKPPKASRASGRASRGSRASALEFAESAEPQQNCAALAAGDGSDFKLRERLLAEGAGTFFVTLAAAAATFAQNPLAPIPVGVIVAIQVCTFGAVSGALFNPALSLALLVSGRGKITAKEAGAYAGVQFLAATLAGLIAFGAAEDTAYFRHALAVDVGFLKSFLLEAIYSAALCSAFLAAGTSFDAPNDYYGIVMGCTALAGAVGSAGFHQGSFNPAVTWGVFLGNAANGDTPSPDLGALVLFVLAPFLGGLGGAALFRATRAREYLPDDVPPAIAAQRPNSLPERLLAESAGTFYLVFTVGVSVAGSGALAPVAIGLILAAQIYTYGSVSGGVFNPAVTLSILATRRRKIEPAHAAAYMGAQCLAGTVAGFVALGISDSPFCFDFRAPPRGSWNATVLLETLFTAVLCLVVLSAGTSKDAPNSYFGLAIGTSVTTGAYALGGLDQGSLNPAVTFGMNLANYAKEGAAMNPSAAAWFLFLAMPMVGGLLAAAIFRGTRGNEWNVALAPRSATSRSGSFGSRTGPRATE